MQISVHSLFFISDQRNWPFDEFRSHLVTVSKIDQMRSAFGQTRSAIGQTSAQFTKRCAFGQMPRVWPIGQSAAHLPKCADWSNAPYNVIEASVNSMSTLCNLLHKLQHFFTKLLQNNDWAWSQGFDILLISTQLILMIFTDTVMTMIQRLYQPRWVLATTAIYTLITN